MVWETQGTPLPGDDRISSDKSVDEVSVRIRDSPDGRGHTFAFKPQDIAFDHPVFAAMNSTWKEANASRPSAVRDLISLDSTGIPAVGMFPATWGLSLGLDDPGLSSSGAPDRVWVFCWDLTCRRVLWGYFASEDGHFRMADGLGSGGSSHTGTDEWLEDTFVDDDGVFACRPDMRATVCPDAEFAAVRSLVSPKIFLAEEWTPDVVMFYKINGTSIHVVPSPTPPLRGAPLPNASAPSSSAQSVPPSPREDLLPAQWDSGPTARPQGSGIPIAPSRVAGPSGSLMEVSAPEATPSFALAVALAATGVAFLVGILLYTRLKRDRVLQQATRKRIYEEICADPGVRVGTLASRLGLDHNAVRYHVRILERFQLVRPAGDSRTRFVPVGTSPAEEDRCTGVLAGASARAVYAHLKARGPCDVETLAAGVGLAYSTVSALVATLRLGGLVERSRAGRRWRVRAAPGTGCCSTGRGAASRS